MSGPKLWRFIENCSNRVSVSAKGLKSAFRSRKKSSECESIEENLSNSSLEKDGRRSSFDNGEDDGNGVVAARSDIKILKSTKEAQIQDIQNTADIQFMHDKDGRFADNLDEIGRASCRERV